MDAGFYLGMNYNDGGIYVARRLIPRLEVLLDQPCTSRWVYSEAHESPAYRLTIATTDLADIARSRIVLLAPLTKTSRGLHVEMGLALALDKPVFLHRPDGIEGVGFDSLCLPWRPEWIEALTVAQTKGGSS